jgi:ribonuclease P protein component
MPVRLGRLKQRADFLRVAGIRRKMAVAGLVLQGAPSPDDLPADAAPVRLGFTVTKKVGNAVVRNRAKRRLRAAAADVMLRHARPGHDYVLIGREGTLTRPWQDLKSDLETALRRLDLWRSMDQETKP